MARLHFTPAAEEDLRTTIRYVPRAALAAAVVVLVVTPCPRVRAQPTPVPAVAAATLVTLAGMEALA